MLFIPFLCGIFLENKKIRKKMHYSNFEFNNETFKKIVEIGKI